MSLKRSGARGAGAVLFVATLAAVVLHAASAAASPMGASTRRGHREDFCPFFSGPSCTNTLLFDVFLEYQRDINDYPGSKNLLRLGGELGYMGRLGNTDSQLGVVAEGGGFLNDDDKSWFVAPKLRLRWWPMHSFTGLELSGGGIYTGAHYVPAGPDLRRWGAQAELGVTFYGAFTIVTGGDWLYSTGGISSGDFFIGARTTLITFPWGILRALR